MALLVAVAAGVLLADQVTKAIVVATLSDRTPVRLLGGWLHLTQTRNPGAAFSLGGGATVVFSSVAILVVLVIARTARRLRQPWWALTLGLLLGGALGNLVDRLFRAPGPLRGHVVDWIQLPYWPVFNIADSVIVLGGCLAVLLAARGVELDSGASAPAPVPPSASGPPDVAPPAAAPPAVAPSAVAPSAVEGDEPAGGHR